MNGQQSPTASKQVPQSLGQERPLHPTMMSAAMQDNGLHRRGNGKGTYPNQVPIPFAAFSTSNTALDEPLALGLVRRLPRRATCSLVSW